MEYQGVSGALLGVAGMFQRVSGAFEVPQEISEGTWRAQARFNVSWGFKGVLKEFQEAPGGL